MEEDRTLSSLEKMISDFCHERDWDKYHLAKDLAIGISTEASELLEIFRFKNEEEIDDLLASQNGRDIVGQELADVFYFLLRFAERYDFDVADELLRKLELNRKRYPVEKAKGSNKKYNEL